MIIILNSEAKVALNAGISSWLFFRANVQIILSSEEEEVSF